MREALAALPPGVRRRFRIVEREALDAIAAGSAPLALAAAPGISFRGVASGRPPGSD